MIQIKIVTFLLVDMVLWNISQIYNLNVPQKDYKQKQIVGYLFH